MKIADVEIVADKMEKVSVEQDELFSLVSNVQCGRMDDQRCSLAPSIKQVHAHNSPDADEFFQFLLKNQGQRFDDQRATHRSLPGMEVFTIREPKDGNVLKTNFDQMCSMVSRAQSFKKNAKLTLSPGASGSVRRASFNPQPPADSDVCKTLTTRSASFNPISDKNKMDCGNIQREQDRLLCLVSQGQRGRMEEQRCSINPFSPSPRRVDNSQSDQEAEKLFKLISNTQNRRLDDQRVTLNLLPGTQAAPGVTAQDSEQLFNMVSRMQGSRIDDQCCSAPNIRLGSPAPPKKSHSRAISPTNPPSESGSPIKSSRRSGSFSPASQVQNSFDQDQLFSLVHRVQQRQMDDQRCSFQPYKKPPPSPNNPIANPTVEDPEHFFNLVANFQSGRMDDQRVTLSAMPRIQSSDTGTRREKSKTSAPQIILTPASPAAPKKDCSGPSSHTLKVCESDTPVRPPLGSASFCPGSDTDRLLSDDMSAQISFQLSICFPPHQTHGANNEPYPFPEVLLTIGQPGEAIVLPLMPTPGRPLSLNVNPPRKHRSRSASPHRSPARQGRSRPSTPHPGDTASPIGPYEDYFSLIQRVHTSQLQQKNGQDRLEANKDARVKGKSSGKKEKKEGNKEKKK